MSESRVAFHFHESEAILLAKPSVSYFTLSTRKAKVMHCFFLAPIKTPASRTVIVVVACDVFK